MRVFVLLLTAAVLAAGCASQEAAPAASEADYTVVIPLGASEDPDADLLAGIPQRTGEDGLILLFEEGEMLRVVNEDTVEHTIGLVVVRPGETIDYFFSVPGSFVGACTLLAGENITVEVA